MFSAYDAIYKRSEEIPGESTQGIPESLRTAIDEGNAAFFGEIAASFPQLFRILVEDCSPVVLLESRVRLGESEEVLLRWGLCCGDTEIILGIPLDYDASYYKTFMDDYLSVLPTALLGFYARKDGMAVVEGIGTVGSDLPSATGNWRLLEEYCRDFGLTLPKNWAKEKFGHDDIRVYISGSRGHLFLVDMKGRPSDIHCVKDGDFENGFVLDDYSVLDNYFCEAVKGFPEGAPNLR